MKGSIVTANRRPYLPFPVQRFQHDAIELRETWRAGEFTGHITTHSALLRYYRRRLLSKDAAEGARLYQAGDEYAVLAFQAHKTPIPKVGSLVRVDNGSQDNGRGLEAAQRLERANSKLGETAASCLFAVCVEDWSAAAWAKARGYNREAVGLLFLVDGLKVLRKYWGI